MQTNKSVIDFDNYYRNRAYRKYALIDAERTPEEIRDDAAHQDLRKQMRLMPLDKAGQTPLIDKIMPYILILAFLGFLFGLYGLMDWFIFVFLPGVF